MKMQLQIISINALIISLLIDIRQTSNQKSFNVKFHSIQSFHNIITTIQTSNLSDNHNLHIKQSLNNPFDLDDIDNSVLLQSKRCSNYEIQEKLQCFDELPQDRYEVLHNSTVNIKCIVRNQHGKVQWRAQNVVLGYDRSVPGMERLSIVGDVSKGEHNLQIFNIQPEDSGEYECQVQPVLKHPLLRKKTQIIVQMLPTTPVILYRQRKLVDHTLIITPSSKTNHRYDAKLILECQSSGGISNVQFIWYWNRQIVSETNQPEVAITSPFNNSSQIELRTDQLKSNDKIQCRVENKASKMIRKRLKTYMELSVTVTIIFYSLPGEPVIINASFFYTHKFEEKEPLNIVCQVSPIGFPKPEIKWHWHFNKIAYMQSDHSNLKFVNENSVELKSHRFYIDSSKDVYNSRLSGVSLSKRHHAANISCTVKQILIKSNYITSVRVLVKHPPSMLKIHLYNKTQYSNGLSWEEHVQAFESINSNSSINLIDGKFYRFACSTSLHYTSLNINWSLTLKNNRKELYNLENSHQSEIMVGQYFKQTTSYVDLKATKEIINMDLMCTAWPMDSIILSTILQLKIFYAPERPVLTGYTQSDSINEYDAVSLLCTSKSGYPLPDLIWYKENSTLSNSEPIVSNEDKISSLLSFKVTREDNGKLINCAARNIATPNIGLYSNFVAIQVIFPARLVKIKSIPFPLKQVMENSLILLTCETDSSNPASDIQWWLIRCAFSDHRKVVKRQVPCSKNKLKESDRQIVSTDFQGWKTISKLQYLVKWLDNENFIECESKLPNMEKTISSLHYDRLRLNIIFAPHFSSHLQNGSVFQAQENFKLLVYLKTFGNPKDIRYTWFKDGRVLESNSTFEISKNTLIINKVLRSYMGNYSFIAENDIGRNEIRFYIDVTYPPMVSGEKLNHIHVKVNRNISVSCEFTANPYRMDFVKWKVSYPSDLLSPTKHSEEWYVSYDQDCSETVTWKNFNDSRQVLGSVTCSSPKPYSIISNYHLINSSQFQNAILQCFYDNNISSPVVKTFIFYRESPPRYQAVRQFVFQGVENSEPAIFTCIFKGYPIKFVEWHNCTSVDNNYMALINNRSNLTLLSETTDIYQIQPNLYRSENKIWHLDWKMLNKICCQAINSFGSDVGLIQILPKSKPYPPEDVHIVEVGTDFLLVKWDQGFDGGVSQTFQVKVRRKDKNTEPILFVISGNRYRNSLLYNISGLTNNVCYVIRVGSYNSLSPDIAFGESIDGCTLSDSNSSFNYRVEANIKTNVTVGVPIIPKINFEVIEKSTSFIVTVAGCVFGFIIIIINVLTFVICYKKKREKNRKRRQSKDVQSTDERQTENLSKYDSSVMENQLYDGSILATSESFYFGDHRPDKEEEIPMLMYQKPICRLHFVSPDQFSNPLIIQDHYLQSAISCSQTNSKSESSCYGCTSVELPLNSMILSNQYLQFPLLESTYNSLLRNSYEYSLAPVPNMTGHDCSDFPNPNDHLCNDSPTFLQNNDASTNVLSANSANFEMATSYLNIDASSPKVKTDYYQNVCLEQNISTEDRKKTQNAPQ